MTCIVSETRYPTKKSLKEALQRGESVMIEDPSIMNPRVFSTKEMERGQKVIVTNHPKRSYFVEIFKDVDGQMKVK
jgi:hypothetical protein